MATSERCENCRGRGIIYYANNLEKGYDCVKITKETWLALPKTEEDAERLGQHYIQDKYPEPCPECDGEGVIYNNDYDEDWPDFDEDAYMERYYRKIDSL